MINKASLQNLKVTYQEKHWREIRVILASKLHAPKKAWHYDNLVTWNA
ncbi:hypothetical protein IQ277_22520 [Nostocales cyanobacterium LEGE 12452]|nr:hypothetical protein [Nostocales cyanobacterium LEGE 12452]